MRETGRKRGRRNRKEDLEDAEEGITRSHRSLPADKS